MNLLGIEFISLNQSWEKWLQIFAACGWFLTFFCSGILSTGFFVYLFFTSFWWLALLYGFWAYILDHNIEERGGRPNYWMKSWTWWYHLKNYFPVKLVVAEDFYLDPTKNYLFGCFPHGIFAMGISLSFGSTYLGAEKYFPSHCIRLVTLKMQFLFPFVREMMLGLGGITSSANSIEYLLKNPKGGQGVALVVGGASEVFNNSPGVYRVILKKRKGFVKLALRNGAPLVPVISFGEPDLFGHVGETKLKTLQVWLKNKLGFAPVVPPGRGFLQHSFGIIPLNKPVTVVVGKPLDMEKIEEPTSQQIDNYHHLFVVKLTELFEQHKFKYLQNAAETQLLIT